MAKKSKKQEKIIKNDQIQPLMVTEASTNYEIQAAVAGSDLNDSSHTQTRRNAAADITRTGRYKNIDDGLIPFRYSTGIANSS
ncbi:hypothetical protein EB118_20460, partial [bacterium]|nr:hypothetical protein [bacterium]